MKETIKTGGVGKSPAIEKINKLNKISSRLQAARELGKKAFQKEEGRAKEGWKKRESIIKEFDINFKRKETENGGKIGKGQRDEGAV